MEALGKKIEALTSTTEAPQAKLDNSTTRIISYSSCPPPFRKFRSLCLLAVCEEKTWPAARQNCWREGGDLLWISNTEEHRAASAFFEENKNCFKNIWAWSGLHRNGGALVWNNPDAGAYRGSKIYRKNSKYFIISGPVGKFYGTSASFPRPSICRRP